MISLISDFDGTLFFHQETPPVRLRDVEKIKQFQKENVFGLCTGRPLRGIMDLKKYGIECDFYILTSGALILNKDFEIISEKSLDIQLVQNLIDETTMYQRAVQAKNQIYPVDEEMPIPILQTVISNAEQIPEPAIGLSVRTPDENAAYELVKRLNAKYDVQALQNENFVDIVAKGCSKGNAVQFIKKYLNLEYVTAIGDSYNDIDMLEVADVAFTFETSPKHVKKAADHLVSGIDQAIDILTKRPE